MGCWNNTCAISQFPLVAGDKTVNFVLVEAASEYLDSTPCYPSGMGWKLIPIPFYGEYNGYGWQEDDDGQQAKYDFLAKHYKNEIVKVGEENERAKHCYGKMNGPFDNNETLGDSIQGNLWNISNPMGDGYGGPASRRMASFMVSRIVWDALTSKTLVDYPKRKWYTRKQIANAVEGFANYMKKQQAIAETDPDSTKATIVKMNMRLLAMGKNMFTREYLERKFKGSSYSDPRVGAVKFCGESMSYDTAMELGTLAPLMEGVITADDVAAVYLLNSAMYSLRKGYHPQTGKGSQSGIDHTHHLLLKAMKDMIKLDEICYGD